MAKKYEADTVYKIKLSEPLKIGPSWLRPDQEVKLIGSFCEEHDAIILHSEKA